MNLLKRIAKHIYRLGRFVVLVVLVLVGAIVIFGGFTNAGGNLVAALAVRFTSNDQRTIEIVPPGALLTGRLRVPSIRIGDAQGLYAEATDLAVDWSPSALFAGTFKAQSISASKVSILRTPKAEQSTASGQSGFSLPIRVDIDAFDIAEMQLGEALVGKQMQIALKGSAKLTEASLAAILSASRIGMPDARLDAKLGFAPAENRLDLDLDLAEPRNGMLAGLLRLPGEPALGISLKGEGPLSDWKATLTAAIENQPTLTLEATHRDAGEGLHDVSAKGSGRFDALLPPNIRALFAGDTAIDFAARVSEQGQFDIERGTLTSASLSLAASGRFDPAGSNDLDIAVSGTNGSVPFEWLLEEGAIRTAVSRIDLSVKGPAEAVALDAAADLAFAEMPQGRVEDVSLIAKGSSFDLKTRSGTVNTELTLARSRFTVPELDRAIRAPAKIVAPVTLTADSISFADATIESASIGGSASGSYNLANGGTNATFKLFALPDVLPAAIAAKFSQTIGLSGAVAFDQPGNIELDNLVLTSSLINAKGKAAFDGSDLSASFEGDVADIGQLMENTSGTARVTLSASGPLSGLTVKADVNAPEARMAGYVVEALSVAASGVADPNALSAKISATGRIDGKSLSADATLRPENGQTVIPDLALSVGPNKLSGAVTLDAAFMPAGNVTFDFPDISLLAALAGQQAEGDLKGQVTLTSANGVRSAKIDAAGSTLRRENVTLSAPEVALTISDLAKLAADGSLKATSITAGANTVEQPVLRFTRAGTTTNFDLAARYHSASLAAKGAVEQASEALTINLASFNAAPRGIELKLAAPTSIAVVNGAADIEGLTIATGQGNIRASGKAGQALDLTINISGLPASLVDRFAADLGAAGAISGKVTVKGTATAPAVDYNLAWNDASVAQIRTAGLPSVNVSASGTYAGDRVQLDLALSGQSALSVRGGGSLSLAGAKPIDMRFSGSLPFALLATQLAQQGLRAEGSATLGVEISGNLAAPNISGTVATSGARIVDVRRNLALEGLAFNASLNGERATISGLGATLAGGGTISGGGTIDLRSPGLPADISLQLNSASYVDGTMLATTASGNLKLAGPLLTSPVLSGAITLDKTSITVPERLPPSLAQLDVTHRNAPAEVKSQLAAVTRKESNGSGSQIGLDLTINAGSQIYVRGRGIDAELGGALTIRGTTAEPNVSGAFTLRRGRLSILNKRLDFTSGTITFGGALIPILDMEATTTSGSTTITISVSGLANDPDITFSSAPALPQDEVLAQLIFGQSMSKLSPLQIAQLADSVSQLAGGRSTSLFQSLRSGLGVDDLDVGTDEQGRARVTAGKYLNDRTYLELQQDADTGGKAIINLDVGRGLKLRGEAGGDGSGGAGIFYEKEY